MRSQHISSTSTFTRRHIFEMRKGNLLDASDLRAQTSSWWPSNSRKAVSEHPFIDSRKVLLTKVRTKKTLIMRTTYHSFGWSADKEISSCRHGISNHTVQYRSSQLRILQQSFIFHTIDRDSIRDSKNLRDRQTDRQTDKNRCLSSSFIIWAEVANV